MIFAESVVDQLSGRAGGRRGATDLLPAGVANEAQGKDAAQGAKGECLEGELRNAPCCLEVVRQPENHVQGSREDGHPRTDQNPNEANSTQHAESTVRDGNLERAVSQGELAPEPDSSGDREEVAEQER